MVIETKYSVEEKVWFIKENKLFHEPIWEVQIRVSGDANDVLYLFKNTLGNYFSGTDTTLFPTKEELLKSL